MALIRGFPYRWRELPLRRGEARPREELSRGDLDRLRRTLDQCLSARGGEVSAWQRASEIAATYLDLGEGARRDFLRLVAAEYATPLDAATQAALRVAAAADPAERREAVRQARAAFTPPWVRLLTQLNNAPGGARFLVELRADLRRLSRQDPELEPLADDLKELLTIWFGVGHLELRRITWDSPASLLERLAASEAVHAVGSWDDLKNRLDTDRRFFAFFHPRMPDEPLVFLEVALLPKLPGEIGPLLDPAVPALDPADASVAVFYSISSTQPGLSGISLGGFLIKQVVDELRVELPRLRTFATLSPIPGFVRWLSRVVDDPRLPLAEPDRARLGDLLAALEDEPDPEPLRERLLELCAHYLLNARRADGGALDPVANFHLGNGARVERLNWLADRSPGGLRDSLGLMVNYLYELDAIESNHEAYAAEGTIAASAAVTRLAKLVPARAAAG